MSWNWKIQKCCLLINALVAQLVERGFCKADVASSSLVGGFSSYKTINENILMVLRIYETVGMDTH